MRKSAHKDYQLVMGKIHVTLHSQPRQPLQIRRDCSSDDLKNLAKELGQGPHVVASAETAKDAARHGMVLSIGCTLTGGSPQLEFALARCFGFKNDRFERVEKDRVVERDIGLHPASAAALLIVAEGLSLDLGCSRVAEAIEAARGRLPADRSDLFEDEQLVADYRGQAIGFSLLATDTGAPTGQHEVVKMPNGRTLHLWRDAEGRAAGLTAAPFFGLPTAATARPGRLMGVVMEHRRKAATKASGWRPVRDRMRGTAARA